MKKIITICLFLIITVCLGIFLYGCNKEPTPIPNDNSTSDDKILETGPDTVCSTNDDCWCRSFTGAEFINEKVASECCKEIQGVRCTKVDHCAQCFYR